MFDRAARTVRLSRIFEWFERDFVDDAGSVLAWVARYAPVEESAWLTAEPTPRLTFLDYSWRLNDLPREGR